MARGLLKRLNEHAQMDFRPVGEFERVAVDVRDASAGIADGPVGFDQLQ